MVVLPRVALRRAAFATVAVAVGITALAVALAQHWREFRRETARRYATSSLRETILVTPIAVQPHVAARDQPPQRALDERLGERGKARDPGERGDGDEPFALEQ